jgi:hypothetical protein
MLENLTSEPTLRLIMVGVAVLFAGMAFLRGVGRLVLLVLALAAGVGAALLCYRYLPGIQFVSKLPPEYLQYAALGVGLVAAFFARKLLNGIVSGDGGDNPDRSKVRSGLLGLIPALLLLWGGAVAARWAGAADYLRHVEQAVKAQSTAPLDEAGLVARLSRSLTKGVLGDIMERTDPMTSRESIAACALLTLQHHEPVWKRAWIHRSIGPVVQLPAFARLRDDHEVAGALSFSHYSRLLALTEVETALSDAALRERVLALEMEKVLGEVITGKLSGPPPKAVVVPE